MSRDNSLREAVQRAIADLSIHPAGCEDWQYYERLCLDVADRLYEAVQDGSITDPITDLITDPVSPENLDMADEWGGIVLSLANHS